MLESVKPGDRVDNNETLMVNLFARKKKKTIACRMLIRVTILGFKKCMCQCTT
jgi:hypothetical protein